MKERGGEESRNIENEMKTGRLNNPFQFAVNYLRGDGSKKSRRTRKGRTSEKEEAKDLEEQFGA